MNLPSQVESRDFSPWLQCLPALFCGLFMLLVTRVLPLGLYRPNPLATVALLFLLAVGGSFYAVIRSARIFPSIWGIMSFLLFQWGVAALWVMANRAEGGKMLLLPGRIIAQYPEWWIPAVITWFGAQGFGRMLYGLQLRPRRPVYSWANQWDEDTVDLTFWNLNWRGLQICTCALLGIGVFVLALASHPTAIELSWSLALGRLLLWFFSCTGLALLAAGNYCYKRAYWHTEGLALEASLRREWRWQTGKILVLLSILAGLLPANFRAVGWRVVLWLVNRSSALPETRGQGMEVMLPNPALFPPDPLVAAEVTPSLGEKILLWLTFVVFLILGMMIGSAVLVFVGYLLHRSLVGQLDSLRGLPKVLVRFYLFFRRLAQRRQKTDGCRVLLSPLEGEATKGTGRRKPFYHWGRGSRALIRRGYYRLLMKARQQGLPWHASQTPAEIGQALTAMLAEETEAVQAVTVGYQEARYGPMDPPQEQVRRFERWRRALEKRLERERQGD